MIGSSGARGPPRTGHGRLGGASGIADPPSLTRRIRDGGYAVAGVDRDESGDLPIGRRRAISSCPPGRACVACSCSGQRLSDGDRPDRDRRQWCPIGIQMIGRRWHTSSCWPSLRQSPLSPAESPRLDSDAAPALL